MRLPSYTVLIVDDSLEDRELYRRFLLKDEAVSYTLLEATTGQEGLALWHQHKPDILLLDYRLPDLNGLEFLVQLHGPLQQPCLPVIMLTGLGNEAIAVKAIKAGAQDYLVKEHLTPERLHLAIHGALEVVQLHAQLQQREEALRQSEAFKDRLLESSPDCIKVLNLEGRLLYMNAGGRCLMEIDDFAPLCNAEWVSFWQGEGRHQAETVLAMAKAGKVGRFRGYCPTAKGTPKWWEVIVSPIVGQDGQVEQILSISRDITLSQQVEGRLKDQQERLHAALQAAETGTFRWDIRTNALDWDENLDRLFGLPPGDTVRSLEAFIQRVHPEDRQDVRDRCTRCATEGIDFKMDFRVVHPDGSIHWLSDKGKTFLDAAGNPVYMMGACVDITERKQTEEALWQSNARLHRLSESSLIGILFWRIDGGILDANDAFLQMLGYTREDLETGELRWTDMTPPEWIAQDQQGYKDILATGTSGPFEKEYYHKDGARVPVLLGSVFFEGSQQEGVSFVLDLSDRKRAEAALGEKQQQLQDLSDALPIFVWIFDAKGQLEYANQQWTEYSGLTLEQTRHGEPLRDICHPADVQTFFEQWAIALQTQQPFECETRLKRASDGVFRWFLLQAVPSFDPQRRLLRWYGTSIDIHERKQSQQEKQQLLEAERAARIAAERANRVKDEFLAILSHELRSPLNPILGWTKLMQTRNFSPERTAEALRTIERNAKLQIQLIDDLLDTAKILRGKLRLNTEPVDLAIVIEAAIDTVRDAAAAKSISLQVKLPPVGLVTGDPARLQQVAWNLLSNAVKFTPKGGQIEIFLERVDSEAQITIHDTGKGITPEFLPHLFESFRQEDSSTTRNYGGLGLGLAIVHHLVEAHGGRVWAESPGEGQGATFIVQLPLSTSPPAAVELSIPSETEFDLANLRVLVVDDESDARELLTVMLMQYNANVLTVSSAAEALSALESFHLDVLVSDIGIPEMDGYALIRQVRTLPPERGGNIPAIALTAYAREEDREQALAAGFQHHITKPIDPDLLLRSIVHLVQEEIHDAR